MPHSLSSRFTCLVAVIALLAIAPLASAYAQNRKTENDPMPVTPEREAAALKFVQLNHPELTELLKGLKKQNQTEYQKAIRELYRTSERLSLVLQRDSERYEAELVVWRISSRIHLVVAQIRTTSNEKQRDELESKLRSLLNEQADARLAVLEYERQRIEQRLQRIDEQINRVKSGREDAIEKQIQTLKRRPSTPVDKRQAAEKNAS